MNEKEIYEVDPRFITVTVLIFVCCCGAGLTTYIVTQSGLITWIVVALSYVVILLVMSVLTRYRT